jgi:hypothetical protein
MTSLPRAEQIERLTLRAIAAYAARAARRGSVVLRGAFEDELIEEPLRMTEKLASVRDLDQSDAVASALVTARVAQAMGALTTPQAKLAALCLTRAAGVVRCVLAAAPPSSPEWAPHYIARAAREAAKIPDTAARALGEPAATEAIDAARSDYEILLEEFGEHQDIVLGEPIDLSDEWWQKKR